MFFRWAIRIHLHCSVARRETDGQEGNLGNDLGICTYMLLYKCVCVRLGCGEGIVRGIVRERRHVFPTCLYVSEEGERERKRNLPRLKRQSRETNKRQSRLTTHFPNPPTEQPKPPPPPGETGQTPRRRKNTLSDETSHRQETRIQKAIKSPWTCLLAAVFGVTISSIAQSPDRPIINCPIINHQS